MEKSPPIPDPDTQQQINDFNQELLQMMGQQHQAIRQQATERQWRIVNEDAAQPHQRSKPQHQLSTLVRATLTGASHWLIEKLQALEEDELPARPVVDEKDVFIIEGTCTNVTLTRKEGSDGEPNAVAGNTCATAAHPTGNGAAPGPDQPDPGRDDASHPRGRTAAADRSPRVRGDPFHRPTGD